MSNIYKINNDKFKSIYFSYNFTMAADEKKVSQNAVLAAILCKSNEKYKTQKEIEKYLNSLYGANFDINIEKFGDAFNVEFRIECINKKYLPKNEDVVERVLNFLYEAIYRPNIENSKFNEEAVNREKDFIIKRLSQRKDDKLKYAISRTEEILCDKEPFGIPIFRNKKRIKKDYASRVV
ncbi:MAG: hypothetical protein RSE00_01520 [Clostridia bacterium]